MNKTGVKVECSKILFWRKTTYPPLSKLIIRAIRKKHVVELKESWGFEPEKDLIVYVLGDIIMGDQNAAAN